MEQKREVYISDASCDFIDKICELYADSYDDRLEDRRETKHKSLKCFQRELEKVGISLSTVKIQKILITGGKWSTQRSREAAALYVQMAGPGKDKTYALRRVAEKLGISVPMVVMNLPYEKGVYKLENKSRNAVSCAAYRKRSRKKEIGTMYGPAGGKQP